MFDILLEIQAAGLGLSFVQNDSCSEKQRSPCIDVCSAMYIVGNVIVACWLVNGHTYSHIVFCSLTSSCR